MFKKVVDFKKKVRYVWATYQGARFMAGALGLF